MSTGHTVGRFTFGISPKDYALPHPRLDFRVILLIRRVLLRAFEILREQGFDLANAKEDPLTAELRSVIENRLRRSGEVHGFSRSTFDMVVRQGQWENYDGRVFTQTPDLFFKLRDDGPSWHAVLSEFHGLFVEAKPVDGTHPVGGQYCDKGLLRFVDGRYAWAMQDGMMLGYARQGRTIDKHLIPAMAEELRIASLKTVQAPTRSPSSAAASSDAAEAIHVSRHRRGFLWRNGKGLAGDIWIYHLWHLCE